MSGAGSHGADVQTDPKYYAVTEGTWPCYRSFCLGPVTLREGKGGGSRVSAATVEGGTATEAEIATAETAMREMGQDPLFMIRDGEDSLDAQLAARGYVVKDPVVLWTCPVDHLCDIDIPPVTAFCVWEPLAIQHEIWAQGGMDLGDPLLVLRAPPRLAHLVVLPPEVRGGEGACHTLVPPLLARAAAE